MLFLLEERGMSSLDPRPAGHAERHAILGATTVVVSSSAEPAAD
jgi:hypothetical protein